MTLPTVILYSNNNQECERAKMLLESVGGEFLEYQLGKDFRESDFNSEFGSSAEYPQVAIGYEHIGGLKDTLHYLNNAGLL
jgi:glutaredoxin